jgi:hypothetical protein
MSGPQNACSGRKINLLGDRTVQGRAGTRAREENCFAFSRKAEIQKMKNENSENLIPQKWSENSFK